MRKSLLFPGYGRVLRWSDRLMLQIRIILALADTEFELRAEKGAFGVWGVLFEPMALILTLLALRILVRSASTDLLNPVVWLTCGIALLYLFRKVGIKSLTGVSKGKSCFLSKNSSADTLLARLCSRQGFTVPFLFWYFWGFLLDLDV